MRRAMLDAMSEDAMAEAARIIQEKVRAGDLAAIKLMYAYGIGKPTPAVNPDRLDVEEWQQHQQSTASPASLNAIVDAMPVAPALTLLRGLVPVLEQRAAAQIVKVLENGPPHEDEDEVLENEPLPEDEDEPDLGPSAGPEYDDSRHLDLPAAGADEAGPDIGLPVAAAPKDDLESDVRASEGDVPVSEDDLESDLPVEDDVPVAEDELESDVPVEDDGAVAEDDLESDLPLEDDVPVSEDELASDLPEAAGRPSEDERRRSRSVNGGNGGHAARGSVRGQVRPGARPRKAVHKAKGPPESSGGPFHEGHFPDETRA